MKPPSYLKMLAGGGSAGQLHPTLAKRTLQAALERGGRNLIFVALAQLFFDCRRIQQGVRRNTLQSFFEAEGYRGSYILQDKTYSPGTAAGG